MLVHRTRTIVKALKKDKTIKKNVPDCIRKPIPDFGKDVYAPSGAYRTSETIELTHRKPKGRAMSNNTPMKEATLFPFLL